MNEDRRLMAQRRRRCTLADRWIYSVESSLREKHREAHDIPLDIAASILDSFLEPVLRLYLEH